MRKTLVGLTLVGLTLVGLTLVGLALAAMIGSPALAQNYHKNFVECATEMGLNPDPSYTHKLKSDGRTARRWYFHSEAQAAVFNDCVARKALAAKPSPKNPR
jgi:hypothetical protein